MRNVERVFEPEARAVMAELTRTAGRPMLHDLRAMVDAIGYGIEWRALPADFPPRQAVYAFFCGGVGGHRRLHTGP
jgi:transposase